MKHARKDIMEKVESQLEVIQSGFRAAHSIQKVVPSVTTQKIIEKSLREEYYMDDSEISKNCLTIC